MGQSCETVVFLREEEILEINRRMIVRFGGMYTPADDNLANPGSLRFVLEAVQGSLFGVQLYPSLFEKAAALAWQIIKGHVFHDGNKRTGIEACRLFLELNGLEMKIDAEVVEMALWIAKAEIEFDEFVHWVKARTRPRTNQSLI